MSPANGWKASQESRRPHTRAELKKRTPKMRISKKRRRSVKDRHQAMQLAHLLP